MRLVVVHHFDPKGQLKTVNLYACTDTDIPGPEVLHRYGCRFQIEFLCRGAKQHAGLTHYQARSANKLHFHLNTALTAVSLAKAAYHLDKPAEERDAFSMADIKTRYANELLLDRFFATFDSDLYLEEIKTFRERLSKIGRIPA